MNEFLTLKEDILNRDISLLKTTCNISSKIFLSSLISYGEKNYWESPVCIST